MMNIKNIEDRQTFERERLTPALFRIYKLFGTVNIPIISGSTALYMQQVYLDDFPNDIDICFENTDINFNKYRIVINCCKDLNFSIDIMNRNLFNNAQDIKFKNITYNGLNVCVIDKSCIINILMPAIINFFKDKGNIEKYNKHVNHMNIIKRDYRELIDEN